MDKIAEWLNEIQSNNGEETNGNFLRALIENLFKAVAELLNSLGEWPIEF